MARTPAPEPKPVRPPPSWLTGRGLGGFHASVGFSVDPTATGTGVCEVSGTVKARHLNINGVVHGGVYATILDTAMGGATVTTLREDEVTATTSLYIEFLRPAQQGATLRARGRSCVGAATSPSSRGTSTTATGSGSARPTARWYIWSAGDGTWAKHTRPDPRASRRR